MTWSSAQTATMSPRTVRIVLTGKRTRRSIAPGSPTPRTFLECRIVLSAPSFQLAVSGRNLLDLDRRDVMKVPERLSQEVLVPPGEVGVARDRVRPGESDVQVLGIEMVEVEVRRRCVLEVGEPLVDKAPEVVGVRCRQID